MPEFINTQDVLSASNIKTAGDTPGAINPQTSNTSGNKSAKFSQLYSESVSKKEAHASLSGIVSNREHKQNASTIAGINGKPVNQVASGFENNGNILPSDSIEEPIQDLINNVNPLSLVDSSESKFASRFNLEGAGTITGLNIEAPESLITNDKEVDTKSLLINSSNESLGSNSKLTSLDLDNAETLGTSVYSGKNSNTTNYQLSQLNSQNIGNATIASTVELVDIQDTTKQTKSIAAIENPELKTKPNEQLLEGLKPAPSEPMKVPMIKDRILNSNVRQNLFQRIEEYPDLKPGNLKSVIKETTMEVGQSTWNQTLRSPLTPMVESPVAINKDVSRIINSHYASASNDLALAPLEEVDSNSLRAQLAMPKSGMGFSSVLLPGTPVSSTLTSHINSQAWPQELNQQLVVFTQKDIKQANLQLNPQHLGPMEVRISMGSEQQVNVSFNTHHGMVKEAIDSALPRLREMFEQQGLNLGDVNVSQHSEQNTHKQQFHSNNITAKGLVQGSEGSVEEEQALLVTNSQSDNLVDYYA